MASTAQAYIIFHCSSRELQARAGFDGWVMLLRDAHLQRDDSRFDHITFDALEPGDLVFFGTPEKVTHVGMHHSPGNYIHSAGGSGVILSEWPDDLASINYIDARRIHPDAHVDLECETGSR